MNSFTLVSISSARVTIKGGIVIQKSMLKLTNPARMLLLYRKMSKNLNRFLRKAMVT